MRYLCELVVVLMCLAVNARDLSEERNVSALLVNSVGASDGVYQNARHENKAPYGTVLRADEFERFARSLLEVKDERCKQDLNTTLWGIVRDEKWAVAMYDASVKGAFGVESGMVYQFGHFDQCLEVSTIAEPNQNQVPIVPKYCLAEVTLDGIRLQQLASRKFKPGNSTIAHWGTCVPASCSAADVGIFLQNFLQNSVTLDEKMCQIEKKLQVTKDMMVYAFVVMFFVALAIASTSYHIHQIYSNRNESKKPVRSTLDMALKSFSIIENLRKIGKSGSDHLGLNSINGIKAIAMLLILGGHALSFMYSGPVYNSEFMAENLKQIQNGFLTNSLLFVDIFLFLSGFLFCRILLIELERRRGKVNVAVIYIGRYIRLTPSYMAVLGFYMTWFTVVGNGPLWESRIGLEQERCQASWWLNILYINNYVGTDKLCMFQSWYLSVDSQLFVLAPAVIYFINKSRRYGVQFLVFVLLAVVAVPFAITYLGKLDPTLMVYADEVQDFGGNPFYIESYIKTHMRATGYILGLLAGYIVHLMQEKGTKIPKNLVRIFWVASVTVGLTSMFSITVFYSRPYTVLESALYAAFHKVGWGLSIGWLVIAVTTGHAVRLQRFLSHRIFAPISRLTYCAYLCNGIVELYHTSEIRTPQYMTRLDLFNKTLMHSFNTFILALFLCLLFESPIHALERILFHTQKKHTTPQKRSSATPSTSEEQIA